MSEEKGTDNSPIKWKWWVLFELKLHNFQLIIFALDWLQNRSIYLFCLDANAWSNYNKVGAVGDGFVVSCTHLECQEPLTEEGCNALAESNSNANAANFKPSNGKCCLKKCDDPCDDASVIDNNLYEWEAFLEKCGKEIIFLQNNWKINKINITYFNKFVD